MAGELNLNQLKAFYYAALCRSITVAADRLFITQPAVSMQIKAMEEQYGTQLFVRKKKKLELTDTGRRLYQVAKKIFGLVGQAEKILEGSREVLRVGSSKTLVRYRLARYVSPFQQSHPHIQIQIHEGSSQEMVESVLRNEIDFAIVGRIQYEHERLDVIPFTEDEVVLLVSPDHHFCGRGKVSVQDLAGEQVILRERGSGTRRLVEKILENTSIVSAACIESGNVDFIKELVRIGRGITLLARMGADQDVSSGHLQIVPLVEGPFVLHIDIVKSKERTLSAADRAFLSILFEGPEKEAAAEDFGRWESTAMQGDARLPRSAPSHGNDLWEMTEGKGV
ncbi:MAG: LysR family transcriptional regulator [Thermodesulfobacteriota bacterium]